MLRPFVSADNAALATIWNTACGADLAITPRLAEYNTRPATDAIQAGQIASVNDTAVGFVLASLLPNDPQTAAPRHGWIDAIAVLPNYQRRGIGSELLVWAETWLAARGCTQYRLGASLHPFTPGYPVQLGNLDYFAQRGYIERDHGAREFDVASDLQHYARTPYAIDALIRPAQSGDKAALREFFRREFPGRWRFEFEEFLREHGRMSDLMLLLTARGVDGFARLTYENSERPIERFYMHRLPKPWGQLGPIGVSADTRGKKYGGALLDAGLCQLRDAGIRGCVIDWTDLVHFYGKFGFTPYREYAMIAKLKSEH